MASTRPERNKTEHPDTRWLVNPGQGRNNARADAGAGRLVEDRRVELRGLGSDSRTRQTCIPHWMGMGPPILRQDRGSRYVGRTILGGAPPTGTTSCAMEALP